MLKKSADFTFLNQIEKPPELKRLKNWTVDTVENQVN